MKAEFQSLPVEEQARVKQIAADTAREYGFSEKERDALFDMMGIPASTVEPSR
jgi:hypothetical protein